jgi:hypothetical protein
MTVIVKLNFLKIPSVTVALYHEEKQMGRHDKSNCRNGTVKSPNS